MSGILDMEIDEVTLSKIKSYIYYDELIEVVDTNNNDKTQKPTISTAICSPLNIPSPPKRQSV